MTTCEHCNKQYDETNVHLPNPIPDGMCHNCGTQLTEEEVAALVATYLASKETK
jgi:rRNA maturation endonuclease Nob1